MQVRLLNSVCDDWTITDEEHPEQEGITHMRIELLNTDKVIEIGQ